MDMLYSTQIKPFVTKLLVWCLARLLVAPKNQPQPRDVQLRALAMLYQTQAVRDYLDAQESYLIRMTADTVASGQVPDSKFFAGRLMELRTFRDKLSTAFAVQKKRGVLASERKQSVQKRA